MENGSIGQALAAELSLHAIPLRWIKLLNCGETFAPQGTVTQIQEYYHVNSAGIVTTCMEAIRREKTT